MSSRNICSKNFFLQICLHLLGAQPAFKPITSQSTSSPQNIAPSLDILLRKLFCLNLLYTSKHRTKATALQLTRYTQVKHYVLWADSTSKMSTGLSARDDPDILQTSHFNQCLRLVYPDLKIILCSEPEFIRDTAIIQIHPLLKQVCYVKIILISLVLSTHL